MLSRASIRATAAAAALLLAPIGNAQDVPLAQFWNHTRFPNEQTSNVTSLLNQAAEISTGKNWEYFESNCITQQVYPSLFSMPSGFVEPFAAFDDFFFVGQGSVSCWAHNTSDGLVVIDSLWNTEEVQDILLPGLEAFGFNGSDIKHLIITHEHVDHYGGAKYIQDTFHPKVYASEACWAAFPALALNASMPSPPTKDQTLVDGQNLTVGGVTFHTVLTPGHTLGTLSLIFPVTDRGTQHTAGFMGGTNTPSNQTLREMKIESVNRLADIAKEMGVDTLISNHWVADHALFNADLLRHRTADAANPFVIGTENYYNYLRSNALCAQVLAARQGEDLTYGNLTFGSNTTSPSFSRRARRSPETADHCGCCH